MPVSVSDTSGNWNETIEHAAKTLGRSRHRHKVFKAIYTGKKNPKTTKEIAGATNLSHKLVLTEGKKLFDEGIVHQTKVDGITAYEKIRFYQKNRDTILKYAQNPAKLAKLPTKRHPSSGMKVIRVNVTSKRIKAKRITIDDFPVFSKVKKVRSVPSIALLPERRLKSGMARILGEKGRFQDWGGERSDLNTTRVLMEGKRREAAFAFKGPGTRGVLTPAKMGKNGDQIQRLVLSPAEIFIIQYQGQIAESVREQLAQLAQLKSYFEEKKVWYGIIDGQDTKRLIAAYSQEFGMNVKRGRQNG